MYLEGKIENYLSIAATLLLRTFPGKRSASHCCARICWQLKLLQGTDRRIYISLKGLFTNKSCTPYVNLIFWIVMRYGMVWYGMVWYGMVWYSIV